MFFAQTPVPAQPIGILGPVEWTGIAAAVTGVIISIISEARKIRKEAHESSTAVIASLAVLNSQNTDQNEKFREHAEHDERIQELLALGQARNMEEITKAKDVLSERMAENKQELGERLATVETRVLGSISRHFKEHAADSAILGKTKPGDSSQIHQ